MIQGHRPNSLNQPWHAYDWEHDVGNAAFRAESALEAISELTGRFHHPVREALVRYLNGDFRLRLLECEGGEKAERDMGYYPHLGYRKVDAATLERVALAPLEAAIAHAKEDVGVLREREEKSAQWLKAWQENPPPVAPEEAQRFLEGAAQLHRLMNDLGETLSEWYPEISLFSQEDMKKAREEQEAFESQPRSAQLEAHIVYLEDALRLGRHYAQDQDAYVARYQAERPQEPKTQAGRMFS